MTSYYLVGDYDGKYNTLGLRHGQTLADCKRMIWWQGEGAFNTKFEICTVDPDERETFVSIETGQKLTVNRGPFTEAAYEEFITKLWGPKPDIDDENEEAPALRM